MSWGIIAGAVAGPLVGGLFGKDSSSKAADTQAGAARASDATQRYFYDTTRADNQPFRDTGLAANNRLAQLLGLGGVSSGGGVPSGGNMSRDQLRAQLINGFSTPGTPASQGVYGEIGNNGDRSPTMGYVGATEGTPGTIDEAGLSAAIDRQYTAQQAAQTGQMSDPGNGSLSRNFSAADLAADPIRGTPNRMLQGASPDYMQPLHKFGQADLNNDLVYQNGLQFGLDQGVQGINRQAAAGGNALSGATLKALTRFGNDYATTKTAGAYDRFTNDQNNRYTQATNDQNTQYGQGVDAYNRFNGNQDRTYNKLAGLSGAGQQATNQVTAAGQNTANQVSASQQGAGNARASGYVGGANAISGAIGQGYNNYQNNQLLNRIGMNNQSGYSGYGGYGANADPLGDFINKNGFQS